MDALKSYSVKQLKNIVATHNASEKANVIKAYGKMKKPELVKAISEQIKQEHLMKILEALQLTSVAVGETMKIKVQREPNKMESKIVNQMLMMMEDAGSKAAEKIRKSGKIDEMTAKQQEAIVDDFMKMMESQGSKMTDKVKKTNKSITKKEEIENIFTEQKTSFKDFAYHMNRIYSAMSQIDGFSDVFTIPKKIKKVFEESSDFLRTIVQYINDIGEKNGLLDVEKMLEDIDEDFQSGGDRYYRQILDPTGFDLEENDDGETTKLYIEAKDMTNILSKFGRESKTKAISEILDKYEEFEFADVNIASIFSKLAKF